MVAALFIAAFYVAVAIGVMRLSKKVAPGMPQASTAAGIAWPLVLVLMVLMTLIDAANIVRRKCQ